MKPFALSTHLSLVIKALILLALSCSGLAHASAPRILSTPVETAHVNELYFYHVEAFEADGSSMFFYNLAKSPAGMKIDHFPGTITWTPTPDQVGEHSIDIVAFNAAGVMATQSYTLTVQGAANSAPIITSEPVLEGQAAQLYTYEVTAQDSDNDPLTVTLNQAPIGMTLSGNTVSWTPSKDQIGNHPVQVRVSDGKGGEAEQSFSIQVQAAPNLAPRILSQPNVLEVQATQSYAYQVVAQDPENDALSYSLEQSAAGMSISPAGLLSWSPTEAQVGSHSVTIRVTDTANNSAVQSFVIQVLPVPNEAPRFVSEPQNLEVQAGQLYSYQAIVEDPENDALSYSLEQSSTGMNISATGLLSWSPTEAQVGSHSVTIRVNDTANNSVVQSFVIQVLPVPNQAPIANDQTVSTNEDEVLTIVLTGTDPENDALTYTIESQPSSGTLVGSGTQYRYTPNANVHGTDSFTFSVNDGELNSTIVTVNVTVNPVNDVPEVQSLNVQTDEDSPLNIQLEGADGDGDSLTFTIVAQPSNGTITGSDSNITYTPNPDFNGTDHFTYVANDGVVNSNTATATLQVNPMNDAPIAEDDAVSTSVNESVVINLMATDVDGDALAFSVVEAPQHGQLSIQNNQASYIPNADFVGGDSFIFIANDNTVDSNLATVSIQVLGFNTAPDITSQPVLLGSEGMPYRYQVEAQDTENDTLSFSLSHAPVGMVIDSATGLVAWESPVQGEYPITITVADAQTTVTQTYDLFITPQLPPVTSQGKDFWFMYNRNLGSEEYLLYVASQVDTEISIVMPGAQFEQRYSVQGNQVLTVDLSEQATPRAHQVSVNQNGIHLTSDQPVVVYLINKADFTTDATILYPTPALGLEYDIATLAKSGNSLGSLFGIVAPYDDTVVTITPSIDFNDGAIHRRRGDSFDIVLNQFDSYQALAASTVDFSGTTVRSSKPIAVFSGNLCTSIETTSACDHLIEQLAPLDSLGSRYFTVPLATRSGDTVRVYATEDNTQVSINDEFVYYLQAGEHYQTLVYEPSVIAANQPIQVMQFSNSSSFDGVDADPFMLAVPAQEQFLSAYLVTTPADGYARNYLNLIVPSASIDTVRVDGQVVDASLWQPIHDSGLMGAQVPVDVGTHTATANTPFGLYVYGFDNYDSYGYLGGMAFSSRKEPSSLLLNTDENPISGNEVCVNAEVRDDQSNLITQAQVEFLISNAQAQLNRSFTDLTNTQGLAEFCFTRALQTSDQVTARVGALSQTLVINWQAYNGQDDLDPIIESSPPMLAYEAQEYRYSVIAADPNNDDLTYTLISGPDGLLMDETGLITWMAPSLLTIGQLFPVRLEVSDPAGNKAIQSFNLIGALPPLAPKILNTELGTAVQGDEFKVTFTASDRNQPEILEWSIAQSDGNASIDYRTGLFSWMADVTHPGSLTDRDPFCYREGGAIENLETITKWSAYVADFRPLVGPLYDSNQNGALDNQDRKAIVGTNNQGHVIAFDAVTGQELWRRTDVNANTSSVGTLINLDGDDSAEFIFIDANPGRLVALNSDGSTRWQSAQAVQEGFHSSIIDNAVIPVDLDADGHYEVIAGPSVFDTDGSLLWQFPVPDSYQRLALSGSPMALDIDLDGQKEVLYYNQVRDKDGQLLWTIPSASNIVHASRFALGNFDDDPYPEIVVSERNGAGNGYWLKLIDHNGDLLWRRPMNRLVKILVADLDKGGYPEIYIPMSHAKYDAQGNEIWSFSGGADNVGASIADVDGDGNLDILRMSSSPRSLNIHDGVTGQLSSAIVNKNYYASSSIPVFVDIDNDNQGEIVVGANYVSVYESRNNSWLPAMPNYAYQHQSIGEVDESLRLIQGYVANTVGQTSYAADVSKPSGRLTDLVVASVSANPQVDNTYRIAVNIVNRGLASSPQGVVIGLYKEAPFEAQNKVGELLLDELMPGRATELSYLLSSDPSTLGDQIFAVIEASPTLQECEARNNIASAKTVAITVTDSDNLSDTQYWRIGAAERAFAPQATPSIVTSAVAGQMYQHTAVAQDANLADKIRYYLESAPYGASIDSVTGVVSWVPEVSQVGTYTIRVIAVDLRRNAATQGVVVQVAPSSIPNIPPTITSQPILVASLNGLYHYNVRANDPDGDYVTYQLTSAPTGMTINALSGRIDWVPTVVGTYPVVVRALDPAGGSAEQSFSVAVIANTPPTITSTPSNSARAGRQYGYTVQAEDADGDALNYTLTQAPTGMSLSGNQLNWTPNATQPGNHPVEITVDDGRGGVATQRFEIVVQANRAPTITSTPVLDARVNAPYQYQVIANDADGDTLSYRLNGQPQGMSITEQGLISWTPSSAGTVELSIIVSDGIDAATQPVTITVAEPEALSLTVNATPQIVDPGQTVTITLAPSGGEGQVTTTLTVNGDVVTLVNHQATLTPTEPGRYTAEATATDGVDTVTQSTEFTVRDPNDSEPPVVEITSPALEQVVTTPIEIIGTVSDDNLASYTVYLTPTDQSYHRVLASGHTSITDGVLAELDPTQLVNGLYHIIVQAEDTNGATRSDSTTIVVEGDLKVGNFSITLQDLELSLAGIPIRVHRTYDSRRRFENLDFGHGWSVGYQDIKVDESRTPGAYWELREIRSGIGGVFVDFCVEPQGAPIITITLPDGDTEQFEVGANPHCNRFSPILDVSLRFTPVGDTQSTLEALNENFGRLAGGNIVNTLAEPVNPSRYLLTTQAGYEYHLDQDFGITQVVDPNGNTLVYTDDGIIHSSGERIDFVRDDSGRITEVVDPNGNRIVYGYNEAGDLVSVTERDGAITRFTYNASHGLLDIIDPLGRALVRNIYDDNGRLIGQEDNEGNLTSFEHDIEGRQSIITDRNGNTSFYYYDDRGNVTSQVDALGHQTDYTFDDRGNQLSQTNALGHTTQATFDEDNNQLTHTDALGNTVSYEYDDRGHETRIADARGNAYLNVYDAFGNLLSIEDPLGNIAGNNINAQGLPSSVVDALGHRTEYTYDEEGNKLTETDALGNTVSFTYDDNGNVLTETRTRLVNGSPETQTMRYTYDSRDRVIATEDPEGNISRTEYNLAGEVIAEVDALGRRTEMDYDAYGRVTEVRYPDGTSTRKTYDAEGNVLTETDARGNTTTFTYDALNRLTHTTAPDGSVSQTHYDAIGRVERQTDALGNDTHHQYDDAGRRIATTDALGNTHRFEYDADGNLIAEVDAKGSRTEYTYNALDQRISTLYADDTTTSTAYDALGRTISQTDQAGVTTHYEYDALGRLTQVTDALGGDTTYSYDELGNKLTQTDALGRTTRWGYDSLGRVISRTLPMGQTESTTYDALGNVATHTDFKGQTTTYRYDIMNRVVSISYADGNSESFTYDDNGNRLTATNSEGTTSYTYDVNNRLISETQPNGAVLTYEYDAMGNKTSLTIESLGAIDVSTYTYDALNRLATVTDADGGVTTYAYDAVGNRSQVTQANGQRTTYDYDALNRLVRQQTFNVLNMVLVDYRYTLSVTGRRTQLEELHSGRVSDYTYDTLYRLVQETITGVGNHQANYSYDAVGNRISSTINGEVTTYQYDDNDRTVQAGSTTYTYDANGSTLQEQAGTELTTYQYDAKNQLRQANSQGQTLSFAYDVNGIRSQATTNGEVTDYVVDSQQAYAQVLQEVTNGTLAVSYVYGDDLISQNRAGQSSYYIYDGLGSTRQLSDITGAISDSYDYDAFGILLESTGDTENSYRYTGEQFDEGLGQYYLRARYYNQGIGRFTQMDTWMGRSQDPVTLHKYLYANVDPVNNIDPSGHMTMGSLMSGINGAARMVVSAVPRFASFFSRTFVGAALRGGVLAIQKELRSCIKTRGKKCRILIPIVVVGNDYPNQREHIWDAQTGNGENFGNRMIAPVLRYQRSSINRKWPTKTVTSPRGLPNSCAANDLMIATAKFGGPVACDEYPFSSSKEGGYRNYKKHRVSLRFIPLKENNDFGLRVLSRLRAKKGDRYIVAAFSWIPFSTIIDVKRGKL